MGHYVSAVPGSGKTETLIRKCYDLMEAEGVDSVVAITFTERAASELMERLKKTALEKNRKEIVKGLPESNVGTIHNFCSRIVRKYGEEVGIHWSFRVMDELESSSLLERTVRNFIIRTRNGKKAKEESMLLERMLDEYETDLEQIVKNLTEIMGSHKGYLEYMELLEGGFFTKFSLSDFTEDVRKELVSKFKVSMIPDLTILLDGVVESYREIKRKGRLMDFDDLLLYTLKIMNRRGEEISKKYRYILVDEFQDTDELQIAIFDSFMRNGSSFFVVGDLNQSIYSFRGAHPVAQERFSSLIGNRVTLRTNRRSGKKLIEFYNNLFPSMLNSERMEGVLDEEGGAYCHICDNDLEIVSEIVKKKLREGEKEGDIAILSRTSTDFFNLRRFLRKEGIESVLVSGESIIKSQEGLDILSIIRYLADPGDEVAQVSLLFSPLFDLGVSDLLGVKSTYGKIIGEKLERYRQNLRKESLDFVLSKIISADGYVSRVLASDDGEEKVSRLYRIMEMVSSHVKTYGGDIFSVMEWMKNVADSKESGPIDDLLQDKSRVKIMTIHQAKGLEFNIVIVYDLRTGKDRERYYSDEHGGLVIKRDQDFLNSPSKKIIGRSERHTFSLGEELRILYVAFTRARKELHLVLDEKNLKDEKVAMKGDDLNSVLQRNLEIWKGMSIKERDDAIERIGMTPVALQTSPPLSKTKRTQEAGRAKELTMHEMDVQDEEENGRAIEHFLAERQDGIEKLRVAIGGARVTISKKGLRVYEDSPVPNNYYVSKGKVEFRM